MSQTEQAQLEQCMEHLAFILDKLGVKEAKFSNGAAFIDHDNQQPVNYKLIDNFCQHISSLYREELTEEEEDLDPDFYFTA